MTTHLVSKIAPQQNTISLEKGQEYIRNWHQFINNLYKGHDKHMPHGIFIPMTDINELSNLQKTVTHIEKNGKKERIYIVGIRAYFCLKFEVQIPYPVWATDYPIEAVLVAVYQTNEREPGSANEYHHHKGEDTHDLIVPVPSKKDVSDPGDGGDYSIYDITRPCPILCDTESPLY